MVTYLRRTYLLPAGLEDEMVAELWSAGTLGLESAETGAGKLRIEAYFEDTFPDLTEVEARWRRGGVETLGEVELPAADWLALWRQQARPIPVGDRFLLDPREPEEAPPPAPELSTGRRLLRLPARRAFGTGSHESTRLALELLEQALAEGPAPARVLDVGTGTGVLAFAARVLGARRVVAFDADVEAVFQARSNARLNGLSPSLFAGTAAALAASGPPVAGGFALVLVNILPERILPQMADLVDLLAPAGELIFSGLLAEQGPRAVARLEELGLAAVAERAEGEWVAYRFAARRPGSSG